MKALKRYMAFFLIIVIFVASAPKPVDAADNVFARLWESVTKGKLKDHSNLVVVLDPGHGGYDSGADGNGLLEKNLNLRIAKYCQSELETYEGVEVYMTREDDTFLGLSDRVAYGAKVKADVIVSIHINSAEDTKANGAEVFYPNNNYRKTLGIQGKKLAFSIQKKLTALGLYDRGIKISNSSITKYKDDSVADYYAIIRGAKQSGYLGIIVEHGFISNKADSKKFFSSIAGLKKLGMADAKGIADYYGLKKAKKESSSLKRPKIEKLTSGSSKKVYLKWQEIEGASGYEVYRSTSKDSGFEKAATIKKSGRTYFHDKVEITETYYYKVRAYKKSGDKKTTGSFSKIQKITLLNAPVVSVQSQSASILKVSWKKAEGAGRYEIYRSTSKFGNNKKIATVKDVTSFTDTKLKEGKTYYYMVRAVGNGLNGKVYSSYSESKWKKLD